MLQGAGTRPVGSKIESPVPYLGLLFITMPPHYRHYYITLKHYYTIIRPKKASKFWSTVPTYAKLNPRTTLDNIIRRFLLTARAAFL
jgi:hypothetical protein